MKERERETLTVLAMIHQKKIDESERLMEQLSEVEMRYIGE
jgi:hypothetical protein